MQKLFFTVGTAICLGILSPTISKANNGPKINLSALKSKKEKKSTITKLSPVKNTHKNITRTNTKSNTNTKPSAKNETARLTKIIKNTVEDDRQYNLDKQELTRKNDITVKMSLEGYERYEENKFLVKTYSDLQLKYADKMHVQPEALTNAALLQEMDTWYGTPYSFGGTTRRGVDCSAFTRAIVDEVFKVSLPRTASAQYSHVEKISRFELEEGDLVFFNTRGGVSHVGLYLGNNKFVHAASSKGVTISDLDDNYWAARYVGAGKFF